MLPAVHGLVFLVRVFSVRFCFLAGQFSRCQSQPRSWRWHRDIFLCPQISPPRSELSPSLSRPELAGTASSFLAEAVFISSQARCFFGFLFFGPRSLFWVPVAQGFFTNFCCCSSHAARDFCVDICSSIRELVSAVFLLLLICARILACAPEISVVAA
jgi:hypothetical protein